MTVKNILIANWKMNKSFDDAEIWLRSLNENIKNKANLPQIVVCPPSILIDFMDELLLADELETLENRGKKIEELDEDEVERLADGIRKIKIGAQDCGFAERGAYTGEISAEMLKDAGCQYVILGHSERRQHNFETNEIVQKKFTVALQNNLTIVLCVGESLENRENGRYFDFVQEQLAESIPQNIAIPNLIIAYEPIWSIGTGKVPSNDEIAEMADFIKEEVEKNKKFKIQNLQILYGGSTNSKNTAEIMAVKNISGLLVGGASLDAEEFFQMLNFSNQTKNSVHLKIA